MATNHEDRCESCRWMQLEEMARKETTALRCMHPDALNGKGRILELDLTEYAIRAAYYCRRPMWCMERNLKDAGTHQDP